MHQIVVNKNALVFLCGLSETGRHTIVDELRKRMPNTIVLDKNVLSDTILDGLNHTTPEYQGIKERIYQTLVNLALDNFKNENTIALLDSYYGDKLTKPGTIEYITSSEYEVKIVYLHCSAEKQIERLIALDSERHEDKLGLDINGESKYPAYRLSHIKNHLRELAQVSHFLLLDTDNEDNLDANIQSLIQYINTPTLPIQINPNINKLALNAVTLEEACGESNVFCGLLESIRPEYDVRPCFTPGFCGSTAENNTSENIPFNRCIYKMK